MSVIQRLSVAGALALMAVGTPSAQPEQKGLADVTAVQAEALSHPTSYPLLRALVDGIGPRLTGSAADARAREWALAEMRRIGLQNVHEEPWQMQRGWIRGYARVQLLAPFHLELTAASWGWSGSTPRGGSDADVVLVNADALAAAARESSTSWAGSVLLLQPRDREHFDTLRMLSELPEFLSAARARGAAAVIASDFRPGILLPHTEPVSFSGGWTDMPVVDVATEQRAMLARLAASARPVRVHLDVQNTFTDHAVESANIVGEIPGAEHPEQVVLVGAHLDCWDLGTGATDDGFGVAAVLGAANAVAASSVKPKRTLRFVLFTGEEQGMLGSRAYVERHRAELPSIVAAVALDWGGGPVTRIPVAGHPEFERPLEELFRSSDLLHGATAPDGYLTFTDAYAFTMSGVAGLALFQESPNSATIGHSAADTFDKVDAPTLQRDTAILGVVAVWIADYPVRIGSVWSPEQMKEFRRKQQVLLRILEKSQ